jgi:hypothetical protein
LKGLPGEAQASLATSNRPEAKTPRRPATSHEATLRPGGAQQAQQVLEGSGTAGGTAAGPAATAAAPLLLVEACAKAELLAVLEPSVAAAILGASLE